MKIIPVCKNLKIQSLDNGDFIAKKSYRYVDRDFKYYGLNKPSRSTPATTVDVWQFTSNCSLFSIFHSLSDKFDDIVLTQAQIINFCELYSERLTDKFANFFVTEAQGEFFAVILYLQEKKMRFHLNRFMDDDRNNYWSYNDCKPRLVTKTLKNN